MTVKSTKSATAKPKPATRKTSSVASLKPAPATRKAAAKTSTKTSAKTASRTPVTDVAEPAASAAASAPVTTLVADVTPSVSAPEMRKKELIDAVVLRSGIKKKDAKPVVEAMLAVLGDTLGQGRELNLKPFGKLKINKVKQVSGGRVIINRIRQNQDDTAPETALADAAD